MEFTVKIALDMDAYKAKHDEALAEEQIRAIILDILQEGLWDYHKLGALKIDL